MNDLDQDVRCLRVRDGEGFRLSDHKTHWSTSPRVNGSSATPSKTGPTSLTDAVREQG